ncbi:MAG: hypothetical protein J0L97_07885, partial [Alphaproteobacteria bacterium]|nr:hypothetical protein [Alphaproteobacteria bacterium]
MQQPAPPQIRHLDLSHKTALSGNGTVVVKLVLSSAEAGALKIKATEEKKIQVEVDPVTGVVTLTGSAASIHAALAAVQLEVSAGFADTFTLKMEVTQGGETQHEKLILYFERASGLHVPMDATGGGSPGQIWDEAQMAGVRPRALEDTILAQAGRGNAKQAGYPGEGEDEAETVTLTLPPVELRPGYQEPLMDVPPFDLPSSAPGGAPVSGGSPTPPSSGGTTVVPPVTTPPPD